MKTITERIEESATVLMDGATGSELQKRGVPMNNVAWSGLATESNPDLVRQVHLDYIRAGAEIIITNTFATGRHMLRLAGMESRTAEFNQHAAQLALQARTDAGEAKSNDFDGSWQLAPDCVWVAGSLSPLSGGLADSDIPSLPQMRSEFEEQAVLLAEAGVDLLLLEMVRDIDFGCAALEAALATGLPVWVGFSCERAEDGRLFLAPSIREKIPFAEGVAAVMSAGGSLAAVMHSDVDVTDAALDEVKSIWKGPTGAYPESGFFKKPHWQFVDIISEDDFAGRAMSWIDQGIQLVGGCCGIGPAHIRKLAERLKTPAM